MARIRSVHPGLFTDADFAFLSSDAQIFYIGLLTQCDDYGAFKWEPRDLKLKLRPGKDGPVEPLLEELQSASRIKFYEIDGRHYGLIRNFRRYQRPKSPKSLYFIPDEFRNYVDPPDTNSEIEVDDDVSFPPKEEKSFQREDGGGNREEIKKEVTSLQGAVDAWNATADRTGLPKVQRLTEPRGKALRKRLDECGGLSGWLTALVKLEASSFLTGRSGKDWRANFDFVLQPSSFQKLLEGAYDDRKPTASFTSEPTDAERERQRQEGLRVLEEHRQKTEAKHATG